MIKRHLSVIGFGLLLSTQFAFAQSAGFALSFTPANTSVTQGSKTSASININGSTTNKTAVTLAVSQGLPSGLSVAFSPGACTPPCNSITTITAAGTLAPGSYIVPIVGAAGGETALASLGVTVLALPKFDYSISLTSSEGFAATGQTVDTTLNVGLLSGTSEKVTLSASGAPSGVSVKFSATTCNPSCSSLVTFAVASAVNGTFPITLSATAGSLTKSVLYNLRIQPVASFDFSLSLVPQSNAILKKGAVNALINLTQLAGTSQNVVLTIGSQPASTTVQVSPTSCKPPCNAVLAITTKDNIKVGSYPITIFGSSGGITRSAEYNLVITDSLSPIGSVTGSGSVVWSALPPYTFTRSLYRGLKGDDVSRLQQYLAADAELYPEGIVSGYYGVLTEKAVGRFQIQYGIVSSSGESGWGLFGPRTRAKMNALLAE